MLETTPISASSAADVVRPTAERVGPIRRMLRSEWLLFLLFVGPNLLLFGVFTYWPMVYSGYLSLVKWDLIARTKEWVGLENYRGLFTDDTFLQVRRNTFFYGGSGRRIAGAWLVDCALAQSAASGTGWRPGDCLCPVTLEWRRDRHRLGLHL